MNEPLQTTLVDIVRFLQDENISFALVDGQATSLRGQERMTADIDLAIAVDVAGALSLLTKLPHTQFRPLVDDVAEVIERSFILPLRHCATNIKVDLAVGLSGFERQMIARAESLDLAGCRLPVATAEDLIIMKVLAGRPRDEDDVRGMIVAQNSRLDWNYCETTAAALGEALGADLVGNIRRLRSR